MSTETNTPAKPAKAAEKKKFRIPGHWIAIGSFVVIFAVFVGFTLAFKRGAGAGYTVPTSISKEEMALIAKDLNPMQQKQLSENPEQRKQLSEELSRLLSIAKQAEKEGITAEPAVVSELAFIEAAIIANNYDQKISGSEQAQTAQAGAFSSVTPEEVTNFWAAKDPVAVSDGITPEVREKAFKDFIDGKIALAKASGQMAEDMEPSEEELKMAKDIFAKTQITFQKAIAKFKTIKTMPDAEKKDWTDFEKSVNLQVKLQRAQFLAQYYGQNVLTKKLEVTDADVEKYLKENPELGDSKQKLATVQEIVKKLDGGGDFAALAKEFSEDPGSKASGGLYEGVTLGRMDPLFEKAALALEPGTYTKTPVETNFGYHIIKLEKKKEANDAEGKPSVEYDVRHILISTQVSDPTNPMARPMSPKDFAKTKLQSEREKSLLDDIKAKNPVNVPTDFELPKVSDEEIQKMMQQQQQMMGPQQGPPQPPRPQQQPQQQPQN